MSFDTGAAPQGLKPFFSRDLSGTVETVP